MSSFTTPLLVEVLPNRMFKLVEPFTYYTDIPCACGANHTEIDVPAGFKTDLASVPRLFWAILPPHGTYGKAAVVHDYCYRYAVHSKPWADKVFREGMKVLGVPAWKRFVMYWAVRLFGKGNFKH